MASIKDRVGLPRVTPRPLDHASVEDLVDHMGSSNSFNARRLHEACAIYGKMITEDATICLTLAGAFTPTGLGMAVNSLMEKGLVDFIISTGANLYHDIHFALDLPVYQGDFRMDDSELLERGLVRIYDVFIPVEVLLETDRFIRGALRDLGGRVVSSSQLHHLLGERLLEVAGHPERSILAKAASLDVPVYTPSPGDSSIGLNLAAEKLRGEGVVVDPDLDVIETSSIVYSSRKNGVVILGGGAPKNFYMQTQPFLSQILSISKGGHDYFIQITMDAPHWGGLSGATHNEAVSWGKMNPKEIGNGVTVYSDFTLAAPILFSYASLKYERPLRRLYAEREKLVENLKNEVEMRNR
ncbi:MAG: deoxyhypusine synthase [Candidatus Bathyarchaeia archaeon]|nr:deoxyhypusine synthase [Candidatus Bathyarchaeota archaeon]